MGSFRSIVFSSVIAGLAVGLIVTLLQQFGTVPLILKAEVFEKAAEVHHAAASPQETVASHDHSDHVHAAEAWEPKDGLERNAYTAAANVLTAIGFAMLLAGFFSVRSGATGENVSWHEGLMWGLAGFLVFTIAPESACLRNCRACQRRRCSRARSGGCWPPRLRPRASGS